MVHSQTFSNSIKSLEVGIFEVPLPSYLSDGEDSLSVQHVA